MKHFFLCCLFLLVSSTSWAGSRHPYYPDLIDELVQDSSANADEIKDELGNLIKNRHRALSYKEARKHLFGEIHLETDSNGSHYVTDVYCLIKYDRSAGVGPGRIPNNNILNTEHTWPQSKFSSRHPKNTQKGDLHHLYPTNNRANGTRGNSPFGNVNGSELDNCEASAVGRDATIGQAFEPPQETKGNIARALFYFSVRYDMNLSRAEREVLIQWHDQDPVDSFESKRNDQVHEIQGNRNPFIDYPELAVKAFL